MQLKTCLDILTLLLRSDGASAVVANKIARRLLVLPLRSDSEYTRRLCSRFAICGTRQSNIFKWLVAEIKDIRAGPHVVSFSKRSEPSGRRSICSEPDDVVSWHNLLL